jgi:hypothetical protein
MIIRKKLITDSSSEHIRNVTLALKENNIRYDIKTVTNKSYVGRIFENLTGTLQDPCAMQYVYIVHVRPLDYEKASELLK